MRKRGGLRESAGGRGLTCESRVGAARTRDTCRDRETAWCQAGEQKRGPRSTESMVRPVCARLCGVCTWVCAPDLLWGRERQRCRVSRKVCSSNVKFVVWRGSRAETKLFRWTPHTLKLWVTESSCEQSEPAIKARVC